MEAEFQKKETVNGEENCQVMDHSAQVVKTEGKPMDFDLPSWSWTPKWKLEPERRKSYGTGK